MKVQMISLENQRLLTELGEYYEKHKDIDHILSMNELRIESLTQSIEKVKGTLETSEANLEE